MSENYLLTYAPNEDSNQPAHSLSAQKKKNSVSLAIQNVLSEDSDQTARMRRLI